MMKAEEVKGAGVPAVAGPERVEKARELFERSRVLAQEGRELALDMAETIKEVRDGQYHKEMGFATLEDYASEMFGLERTATYRYLQIADGVMARLPEWAVKALASPGDTFGAKPLPLKVLAAMRLDRFSPGELARIEGLGAEAQREELLKLGYDRDRMGGRAASDLMRPMISKRTYRDQLHKLQVEREKMRAAKAEMAELFAELKAAKAEVEQARETLRADDKTGHLQKQIDLLTERMVGMQKEALAQEAAIATGKEVGKRALELVGETKMVLGKFEDTVRPDDAAGWRECWDAFETLLDVVSGTRARMADVLQSRMEEGEVARFAVNDPGLSERVKKVKV